MTLKAGFICEKHSVFYPFKYIIHEDIRRLFDGVWLINDREGWVCPTCWKPLVVVFR